MEVEHPLPPLLDYVTDRAGPLLAVVVRAVVRKYRSQGSLLELLNV